MVCRKASLNAHHVEPLIGRPQLRTGNRLQFAYDHCIWTKKQKTKQCPISAATFVWWGHTLTQTTWKHEYMHPCINGDTRMHVFMLQGILRAPTEHHLNTSAYLSTAADHFYPFRVFMLWCFNLQYKVPWGDCEIYLKK